MKRISLVLALTLVAPNAMANEIAGTRVSGQGAVCAEGQGKGVEYNIATKEETSYCYEREPVIPPTQEQLEAAAQQVIAEKLKQKNALDAQTHIADTTVSVEAQPIVETLYKLEVNVSTGVTTISTFTEAEKQQAAKDRAVESARQIARTEAHNASLSNVGVRQCVNWSSEGQNGTECALEPTPPTQEEVTNEFNELKAFFDFDWLAILLAWLW